MSPASAAVCACGLLLTMAGAVVAVVSAVALFRPRNAADFEMSMALLGLSFAGLCTGSVLLGFSHLIDEAVRIRKALEERR